MTIRKPDFITFTGADDHTDVDRMWELSQRYPIEWGILFSPTRQGLDNRYPGRDALVRLRASNLRLAGHLCGGHARDVMQDCEPDVPDVPLLPREFSRFQINHTEPNVAAIARLQDKWGRRCIAQTTQCEGFPEDDSIDWLFDASGGRGRQADTLPPYPGRKVGYAGGIGPENVLAVIERINVTGPYWIDMESSVRTNNWFDLELCRKVCETVYGTR